MLVPILLRPFGFIPIIELSQDVDEDFRSRKPQNLLGSLHCPSPSPGPSPTLYTVSAFRDPRTFKDYSILMTWTMDCFREIGTLRVKD